MSDNTFTHLQSLHADCLHIASAFESHRTTIVLSATVTNLGVTYLVCGENTIQNNQEVGPHLQIYLGWASEGHGVRSAQH
jgi:hypothetical protein